MGEQVAVVGGTGFLGSHLVLALRNAGYTPVVVARRPEMARQVFPDMEVEARQGDITDLASLRLAISGCAVVHHVAALLNQIFTAPSRHLEDAAVHTNVEGTLNVLRVAHEAGVRLVVLSGTCTTRYVGGGVVATEDSPATDLRLVNDPYIRSKLAAEAAALEFGRDSGLKVVLTMPGGLVGPGDRGPSPLNAGIVDRLNGKVDPSIEGGFPVVDVRDVARAHVAAMERGRPGAGYLLVERTISARDWLALLDRVAGVPASDRFMSPRLAMAVATLAELLSRAQGKAPIFTRNMVRHIAQNQQYDCSRAREELGLVFAPIETSMRDMVAWFVENGRVRAPERRAQIAARLSEGPTSPGESQPLISPVAGGTRGAREDRI